MVIPMTAQDWDSSWSVCLSIWLYSFPHIKGDRTRSSLSRHREMWRTSFPPLALMGLGLMMIRHVLPYSVGWEDEIFFENLWTLSLCLVTVAPIRLRNAKNFCSHHSQNRVWRPFSSQVDSQAFRGACLTTAPCVYWNPHYFHCHVVAGSIDKNFGISFENFSSFQRRRKVRVGLDNEPAEFVISPLIGPLRSPGGGGREERRRGGGVISSSQICLLFSCLPLEVIVTCLSVSCQYLVSTCHFH